MEHQPNGEQTERIHDLVQLARAIFDAVDHETDTQRLQQLDRVAGEAKELFDLAEDGLHPDLGLELSAFATLKLEGENTMAASSRNAALQIIDSLSTH